jgi:hypothetical protein
MQQPHGTAHCIRLIPHGGYEILLSLQEWKLGAPAYFRQLDRVASPTRSLFVEFGFDVPREF